MIPKNNILRPDNIKLKPGDNHIWFAFLNQSMPRISKLLPLLSIEEKRRAEQFVFEKDKYSFIIRRGILRKILSYYLNVDAKKLIFSYHKNGKPWLNYKSNSLEIRFNISYSNNLGAFAFGLSKKIGVDIEFIRPIPNLEQIVNNYFSGREKQDFQDLPENEKMRAFFNCWTRKEAFIKATGEGLSLPLNSFDVSLKPSEPARLLSANMYPRVATNWALKELKPAPGFAGALATEGPIRQLQCWMWPRSSEEN